MAHQLFPETAGVHGALYGGLLGPSPAARIQRPAAEFSLEAALTVGLVPFPATLPLPPSVDFRTRQANGQPWVLPVMGDDDQGQMGACASFAAKHMDEFVSLKVGHTLQEFAPLWIYREMQLRYEPDQLGQDTGAFLSWAAAVMCDAGFARESDYPYSDNPAALLQQPSWTANFRATWYKNRVAVTVPSDPQSMKATLAAGHAFMLGFQVCQSFYNAQGTGRIPIPPAGDTLLGGHAVLCIGFADDSGFEGGGYLLLLNQWSGFSPGNVLMMPYAYVGGDRVSDCWAIALAGTPS